MGHSAAHEILVVDDELSTAEFLAELLRRENYDVYIASSVAEATALLQKHKISVIVSDLCLGPEQGTDLIGTTKEFSPAPQIIFITGYGSVDSAVSALHDGAFDYISKPMDLRDIEPDLKSVVTRAIRHRESQKSAGAPIVASATEDRSIVGSSPSMVRIYRALAKAALSRENVLLSGESGTGKELVARAIHEKGPWAEMPFVTVNCCALTETLLESELFGHVRGSFTGATQNKMGLFEEANHGTLFLDEIGDLSLSLQVKLLRAIQEGEIKPVGSNETKKVDVRLVVATHRELQKLVHEGKFREDLYYRLKVVLIELPPLRERQQDIPELVTHFLARYVKRSGKKISEISPEAMEILLHYPWPGNIRELENAISRAATMTSSNVLYPEDFPEEILTGTTEASASATLPGAPTLKGESPSMVGESLEDLEKKHIARTLESVNFNKSKAAEILGIDRVTLYRKAFKYGILSKAAPPSTGT